MGELYSLYYRVTSLPWLPHQDGHHVQEGSGFNVHAPCSPEKGLAPRDRQLGWHPP